MRFQHPEKNVGAARGSRDTESPLQHFAGLKAQVQREQFGGESAQFESLTDLNDETIQDEEQRFDGFHFVLEVERLFVVLGWAEEVQRACSVRGSGGEKRERFKSEPFSNFGLPQCQQFAHSANAPLLENACYIR